MTDPVGVSNAPGQAPGADPRTPPAQEGQAHAGLAEAALQPVPEGPGAMLARSRAARGMSVSDVAARLKFAPRQIEALEADEYARLPGMTFVRGMIRSYAKLLSIDSAALLGALERRHAPAPVSMEIHSESVPFPDGRTRSTRVYLALCGVIILVVGALLYEWQFGMPAALTRSPAVSESVPDTPAAEPPKAAEEPAAEAPVAVRADEETAAQAPARGAIELEFQDQSWVEVRDRGGKVLMSQLNPAGSRKAIDGDAPFSIVIGKASSVRLTYKDVPVDLKPHTTVDVARLTLN